MAVAKNDSGTASLYNGGSTASADLTTFTVTAGSTYLVCIAYSANGIASVNWDSGGTPQSMSLLIAGSHLPQNIYGLANPTSGNLTLTVAGTGGATDISIFAIAFSGADTVTDTNENFNGSAVSTGTLTITSSTDGATVVGMISEGTIASTDAPQTQIGSLLNLTVVDVAAGYKIGGTSNQHDWTMSPASDFETIGVHVTAAGGGRFFILTGH